MVFLRLTRKSGNQGGAERNVRDLFSEFRDQPSDLFVVGSPAHPLQHSIACVLDRDIQIVTDFFFSFDRLDELVGDLLRVAVLEADPLDTGHSCQTS